MKINTDGILIGAMSEAHKSADMLDIGTGTGVIALMLAQRFPDSFIDAVESDQLAANTAKANFANSPYINRLTLHANSFESFFKSYPEKQFDLIVSNPPFYINSLQSPKAWKNLAKHADAAFFQNLIAAVPGHLTNNGLFWLILPIATAVLVKKLAGENNFYLQRVINIKSYPSSPPHREILVLGLQQSKINYSEFVIYDKPKQHSGQYRTVLQDFLTIFP